MYYIILYYHIIYFLLYNKAVLDRLLRYLDVAVFVGVVVHVVAATAAAAAAPAESSVVVVAVFVAVVVADAIDGWTKNFLCNNFAPCIPV
mmetsp:Transcript_13121/g.12942  ORF Transcript_13121/g.12942 Transcript_13121/m.12942 type:complete len:90 (-) Transcript_13121:630-899(-)